MNAYFMDYKNQLILTGEINDVGGYTRQNVADSYRLGLEIDGSWKINTKWNWTANLALSRNRIEHLTTFIDNYDNATQQANTYHQTNIAFSPGFVASSELAYTPVKSLQIALISKYVSDQFLDNTSNSNRSLDAFFVNDLRLSHQFKWESVKHIGLNLLVNNLFNTLYEPNGYTFSYISGGQETTENFYYPQATRNLLVSLNMRF
jgi:iron complex outermembrane receptor protein